MIGGGDDTLVRTTTTAGGGFYLFIVPPGSYYVAVVSSSAPLAGLNSSTGGAHNPDTSGDHPAASGDDGVPGIVPGKVVSQVFSATVGGQSTSDTGDPADWTEFDNSSYMTIDFGFTSPPNAVTLRDLRATTLSTGERLMALLRSWLQR